MKNSIKSPAALFLQPGFLTARSSGRITEAAFVKWGIAMLDLEKQKAQRAAAIHAAASPKRKSPRIMPDEELGEPVAARPDRSDVVARILAADVRDLKRPTSRADCAGVARPCPFVSCSHNLFLRESPETGKLEPRFAGRKLKEMKHSCALDLLEKMDSLSPDDLGWLFGCTKAEFDGIVKRAEAKVRTAET